MNLAHKKILGQFTKVLGIGKTPPPLLWENFPNNPVIFFRVRPLIKFIKLCVKVKHNSRSTGDHQYNCNFRTRQYQTCGNFWQHYVTPMYRPNVSHQWSSLFVGAYLHRLSLEISGEYLCRFVGHNCKARSFQLLHYFHILQTPPVIKKHLLPPESRFLNPN